MAIDLQALGYKLRRYRDQLKESVEDVSRCTGTPPDRLSGMEEGSIRPSGDELLILADHWACDFQVFISDEDLEGPGDLPTLGGHQMARGIPKIFRGTSTFRP